MYYDASGWLIAYPIEVFHRPNIRNFKKAIKKLKKESTKFGVIPFMISWAGNVSFGIRIKTMKPTQEENEKMLKVFKYLKNINWPEGFHI